MVETKKIAPGHVVIVRRQRGRQRICNACGRVWNVSVNTRVPYYKYECPNCEYERLQNKKKEG